MVDTGISGELMTTAKGTKESRDLQIVQQLNLSLCLISVSLCDLRLCNFTVPHRSVNLLKIPCPFGFCGR